MSAADDKPIISAPTMPKMKTSKRYWIASTTRNIRIPEYQRDSDEWDDVKKSLFIESILNRLTVPAFYLAPSEGNPDQFEVVDGQQRLTTLNAFFKNDFTLRVTTAARTSGKACITLAGSTNNSTKPGRRPSVSAT